MHCAPVSSSAITMEAGRPRARPVLGHRYGQWFGWDSCAGVPAQRAPTDAARVILMPEGTRAATLRRRSLWLVEICKQEGYHFSPRLHSDLYGNRRGV